MTAYRFRGMDNSANDVRGFLDAESNEEAQARLRGQGIFVTNLSAFAPEVTPEWSAISLSSPSNIPSGQLLAQGVPCTHEQGGMKCDGSLNLLGVGNQSNQTCHRCTPSKVNTNKVKTVISSIRPSNSEIKWLPRLPLESSFLPTGVQFSEREEWGTGAKSRLSP